MKLPIPDFHGETFVAVVQIGTVELPKFLIGARRAVAELANAVRVDVIQVASQAVLFAHSHEIRPSDALEALLSAAGQLHREALARGIVLATSIAYGTFHYEYQRDHRGLEKHFLTGTAYLAASRDAAARHPELQPGECRLVAANLPTAALHELEARCSPAFALVHRERFSHFYYRWADRVPTAPGLKLVVIGA